MLWKPKWQVLVHRNWWTKMETSHQSHVKEIQSLRSRGRNAAAQASHGLTLVSIKVMELGTIRVGPRSTSTNSQFIFLCKRLMWECKLQSLRLTHLQMKEMQVQHASTTWPCSIWTTRNLINLMKLNPKNKKPSTKFTFQAPRPYRWPPSIVESLVGKGPTIPVGNSVGSAEECHSI